MIWWLVAIFGFRCHGGAGGGLLFYRMGTSSLSHSHLYSVDIFQVFKKMLFLKQSSSSSSFSFYSSSSSFFFFKSSSGSGGGSLFFVVVVVHLLCFFFFFLFLALAALFLSGRLQRCSLLFLLFLLFLLLLFLLFLLRLLFLSFGLDLARGRFLLLWLWLGLLLLLLSFLDSCWHFGRFAISLAIVGPSSSSSTFASSQLRQPQQQHTNSHPYNATPPFAIPQTRLAPTTQTRDTHNFETNQHPNTPNSGNFDSNGASFFDQVAMQADTASQGRARAPSDDVSALFGGSTTDNDSIFGHAAAAAAAPSSPHATFFDSVSVAATTGNVGQQRAISSPLKKVSSSPSEVMNARFFDNLSAGVPGNSTITPLTHNASSLPRRDSSPELSSIGLPKSSPQPEAPRSAQGYPFFASSGPMRTTTNDGFMAFKSQQGGLLHSQNLGAPLRHATPPSSFTSKGSPSSPSILEVPPPPMIATYIVSLQLNSIRYDWVRFPHGITKSPLILLFLGEPSASRNWKFPEARG